MPEASIKINYRSNGEAELEALDKEVFRCIEEACAEETARWGKDTITYSVETYFDIKAALWASTTHCRGDLERIEYLGNKPFLVEGVRPTPRSPSGWVCRRSASATAARRSMPTTPQGAFPGQGYLADAAADPDGRPRRSRRGRRAGKYFGIIGFSPAKKQEKRFAKADSMGYNISVKKRISLFYIKEDDDEQVRYRFQQDELQHPRDQCGDAPDPITHAMNTPIYETSTYGYEDR